MVGAVKNENRRLSPVAGTHHGSKAILFIERRLQANDGCCRVTLRAKGEKNPGTQGGAVESSSHFQVGPVLAWNQDRVGA